MNTYHSTSRGPVRVFARALPLDGQDPARSQGLAHAARVTLGVGLALTVLAVDAWLVPGHALSTGYLLPLLLGLWIRGWRYVVVLAALATAFTGMAWYWAPAVGTSFSWIAPLPTWIAVWVTAGGLLLYKSAVTSAEDERAKTRAIFDTAVDGMVSIDDLGTIERFNRAAESMFGYSAQEVLGKNVSLLMPSPHRERHDEYLARYRSTGERRVIGIGREVEGQRKDGSVFPLELALAEVKLAKQRVFTAIVRDITERKERERDRELLLQTLTERNAELDRFAYTVSHDLKSPLVTIKGFLGAIERAALEGKTDRLRADIARVEAAADRMRQLLDELLELSRIGRVAGPSEEINLNALIAETAEALAGAVQSRGVLLDVAQELPNVRGDRVRLRQVFQNLLENALKFMGDQPKPRIEVGARREAGRILCWIRDNGIGIEASYLEKVFGLFEKLDRSSPGTGIGLALVRRILEVHGGRIWGESLGKGSGTCFYFTLPDPRATEAT